MRQPLCAVILHRGFSPPFWTARGRPSADGEQRELKLDDQPSNQIYATEEGKQESKKEHVVHCTHNHLFHGPSMVSDRAAAEFESVVDAPDELSVAKGGDVAEFASAVRAAQNRFHSHFSVHYAIGQAFAMGCSPHTQIEASAERKQGFTP
jgi:hypothetical protein